MNKNMNWLFFIDFFPALITGRLYPLPLLLSFLRQPEPVWLTLTFCLAFVLVPVTADTWTRCVKVMQINDSLLNGSFSRGPHATLPAAGSGEGGHGVRVLVRLQCFKLIRNWNGLFIIQIWAAVGFRAAYAAALISQPLGMPAAIFYNGL